MVVTEPLIFLDTNIVLYFLGGRLVDTLPTGEYLVSVITELSRQEIEAMFGLSDLKQTRFYQEAKEEGKEEGKLETVPLLLQMGLSIEQIAERLGLDITAVSRVSQASAGDTPEG